MDPGWQVHEEASMRERRKSSGTAAAAGALEPLRSENQHLLAFLDELSATPDEKGAAWWEEFRSSLKATPILLGHRPTE